jgi:hypothetical protein
MTYAFNIVTSLVGIGIARAHITPTYVILYDLVALF